VCASTHPTLTSLRSGTCHPTPATGNRQLTTDNRLQLLAPAGDWAALNSALEAGADAVCFGLTILNSCRRAKNFRPEELLRAVQTIHAHRGRAFLALDVDLTGDELGQAARALQLARHCGVDAVLVCDAALLALRPEFPELQFHFSAAAGFTSQADVAAAGSLGLSGALLARELTWAEIAAASAAAGVATAVVVGHSPCAALPGRCLLSSWISGHSARRGVCDHSCRDCPRVGDASSCRAEAAIDRLVELPGAGVAMLAIDGRRQPAEWIRRAVKLFRAAIDGQEQPALAAAAAELEAYAGQMTPPADDLPIGPTFDLEINVAEQILCRCRCAGQTSDWTMPKTVVRRKAIAISQVFEQLGQQLLHGYRLDRTASNAPEFMLVPRAANVLIDRISAVIHQARKAPNQQVRIELPASLEALLETRKPSPANDLPLGTAPNRARLEAAAAAAFLDHVRPESIVVEGLTADNVEAVLTAAAGIPVVAALPAVFFEHEVPALRALIERCVRARTAVEVNSWGGWRLARDLGAKMESGPGLPVLNSLAAWMLQSQGVQCVTLSLEADRRQLEQLTSESPVPFSVVVFGRPPLCVFRAPGDGAPAGATVVEGTNVRLVPRREDGLLVVRPADPFDLRGTNHEGIRAKHLVVDLVGSADPVGDWRYLPSAKQRTFRFNYDRTLV